MADGVIGVPLAPQPVVGDDLVVDQPVQEAKHDVRGVRLSLAVNKRLSSALSVYEAVSTR